MSRITRTARRVARELNSLHPDYLVAFDEQGRVTGRVCGKNVNPSGLEGTYFFSARLDGLYRWTQRAAQDHIDAQDAEHAADQAAEQSGPAPVRVTFAARPDAAGAAPAGPRSSGPR